MSSTTAPSQSSSSVSAPSSTTVSSITAATKIVKEKNEMMDEYLIELTASDVLKDDWDMVTDADIPIANSNAAEPDWETVRLVTDMINSDIDGENYVAGDFTCFYDKKKLLVALGENIVNSMKLKETCEEKDGVINGVMIKAYEERVAALSKAKEIIEASIVA